MQKQINANKNESWLSIIVLLKNHLMFFLFIILLLAHFLLYASTILYAVNQQECGGLIR